MSWACSSCPSRVKQEARLSNRFLPPNYVQVVAHIVAVSPFLTFDSRPSTLDCLWRAENFKSVWLDSGENRVVGQFPARASSGPAARRGSESGKISSECPVILAQRPETDRADHIYGMPTIRVDCFRVAGDTEPDRYYALAVFVAACARTWFWCRETRRITLLPRAASSPCGNVVFACGA
jgi:hypothetical protein